MKEYTIQEIFKFSIGTEFNSKHGKVIVGDKGIILTSYNQNLISSDEWNEAVFTKEESNE